MTLKMKRNKKLPARFLSHSSSETIEIAQQFCSTLSMNTVIALHGDLGAGKTTFVKGVAKGLGALDMDSVSSPTFSYLNIYDGQIPLFHFDLYRMNNVSDFILSGFEDYFHAGGICCIEWPCFALEVLPKGTILIDFKHQGMLEREIIIRRIGESDETIPL